MPVDQETKKGKFKREGGDQKENLVEINKLRLGGVTMAAISMQTVG